MAEKRDSIKFTTPRGVAIWPKLQTPDTKFKAEGQYTCKLRIDGLPDDVMEKLMEMRDRKTAEFIEGIKNKSIVPKWNPKERQAKLDSLKVHDIVSPELDAEGEETGCITINAKMTATGVSKKDGKAWKREPKVFDANGDKIYPLPSIFGGSVLKLAVEAMAYAVPGTKDAPPSVGVTFYLEAVKILKLVSAGDRSADSFGFGEAEEGYVSAPSGATEAFSDDGEEDRASAPKGEREDF